MFTHGDMLRHAEKIDAFRLIPRFLIIGYGYLVWKICFWFMLLHDPTTQQVTFVSTIVGIAGLLFTLYVNTGRDWQAAQAGLPPLPPTS